MNTEQAINSLQKAGYFANASTVKNGYVEALDPIRVESGSKVWTEWREVVLHTSQVSKFVSDRN
jgi:hypothetical protein